MTESRAKFVADVLQSFRYHFASELQLHEGIAVALTSSGIPFEREVRASASDRFDFLCDGGILIEAKIDGTMPAALRQVDRYCIHDRVIAVVIASNKQWARGKPLTVREKPVHLLHLSRQAY